MRQLLIILSLSTILFPQDHDEVTCSRLKMTRAMIENHREMTRNQLNYDVKYYDMDLDIDPTSETISGSVGVKLESLVNGLNEVDLDLYHGLNVNTVTGSSGEILSYSHSTNGLLSITLSTALNIGEISDLIVHYSGTPGTSGFGSFGFSSYSGQDMIWSLSEPYGSRNWWPCKDTPMDKADSVDISITVPEHLIVASNGLLVNQTSFNGLTTYHWEERYPITTYLVSVAIYPYTIYHDWYVYGENDSMRLDFYQFSSMPSNYYLTDDMITAFATRFGEYPFIEEKYGHADFVWGGGMEHQTMTSMGGSSQHLISHELAHQWWGDMVTCTNFHHIWINEGFATYGQAMWWEMRPDGGMEDLHLNMAYKEYWGSGTIYVTDTTNVSTIFNGNLSYNKASWVLHMLRHIVGDDVFFEGLLAFGEQYRFSTATTEQFRDIMEGVSGMDLDAYFQRWIYGEFYPQYRSTSVWADLGNNMSVVDVTIHQDQSSELFQMPVDVVIQTDISGFAFVADVTGQSQTFQFIVDGTPNQVNLDPSHWILRTVQDGGLTQGTAIQHYEGWSLVGLPLEEDYDYLTIFPEAVEGTFFQFEDGTYVNATLFEPGIGYWVRNTTAGTIIMEGTQINSLSLVLEEGWNLISSIAAEIPITMIYDPNGIIVSSTFYTYDEGYTAVEVLTPGKAYWVRTNIAGEISIILTP